MIELIKITEQNGRQVVSGRELHQFLESKQDFSHWSAHRIDYCDLKEGEDFTIVLTQNGRGRPSSDYAFTIDAADEISMVEKNSKGKEARKYFIKFRNSVRDAMTHALPPTYQEALRALADKTDENEALQIEAADLAKKNAPMLTFANSVEGSKNSILVRDFAKRLSDDGFKIGQNRLFKWLRSHEYLMNNNDPYQKYIDAEYFEVVVRSVGSPEGSFTVSTTKITGKGQIYFAKKIKDSFEEGNLAI